MSDRPEDRPEERRRTGPLGDSGDAGETRRVPPEETDSGQTRRVPNRPFGTGERADEPETQRVPQRSPDETGDKETRVIRTPPGGGPGRSRGDTAEGAAYSRGDYFEAAEEREDRLRDMYGGVDWLASFLGFVFVAVVGSLFALVAGLVLGLLGFSPNLGGGPLGAAAITGLVLVAVLIFLAYFFGGYVAGRLARFDGGRNGAMLLLWSFIAVALLVLAGGVFGGFLPAGLSETIQNNVLSTIGGLSQLGLVGLLVAAGVLLAALLGGMLGGRLGSRYHAEIDRTT
jgi:membrane protease YdiL (CAAX protease family)